MSDTSKPMREGRRVPEYYARVPVPLHMFLQHLSFALGNVVKYVVRHRSKGGIDDLEKALDYLELESLRPWTRTWQASQGELTEMMSVLVNHYILEYGRYSPEGMFFSALGDYCMEKKAIRLALNEMGRAIRDMRKAYSAARVA